MAIIKGASMDARAQTTAITSEFQRRGLAPPGRFNAPDHALWETGYAAEAKRSLLDHARTLDEALAAVRPYIDPIFNDSATGRWNPKERRWSAP